MRRYWLFLLFIPLWVCILWPWDKEPGLPAPPGWSGIEIEVREPIELSLEGHVYDYEWARLKWTGAGDCSQAEGMDPMFQVTAAGVTISRVFIEGAPDGIHIWADDVILSEVVFLDVCEDAVTTKAHCDRLTVADCWFAQAADKVLQITKGKDHTVKDSVFADCVRPIRLKPDTSVSVEGCTFIRCGESVKVEGAFARIDRCRFVDCRHELVTISGGRGEITNPLE